LETIARLPMDSALELSPQFRCATSRALADRPPWAAGAAALSRGLIALAVILFAATRLYIFFGLQPQFSDVQTRYFNYAARVADLHQIPYQPSVEIEYPPLAWWAMYLPRIFDGRKISNPRDATQVAPVYETYRAAFRGQMLACDLVSFALLIAIVRRRRPSLMGWAALAYVAATAILAHVLYDRLDAGLLMLIMLWAFCWTRSLEAERKTLWAAAAYAALGLSISYKLVPIVCIPFLLLSEFRQPRRWLNLSIAGTTLLLAACGPFLIQFLISGLGIFHVLSYHAGRGIQFESLYATAMMVGQHFGAPAHVAFLHGSYELTGDLAPLLKGCAIAFQSILFSGLGLLALLRGQTFDRQSACRFGLVALVASVILSNVLSPQYFVWALPIVILLSVETLSEANLLFAFLATLIICIAAATTWLFPYHYFGGDSSPGLIPMRPSDGGLVLIRGVLSPSGPARISLLPAAVLALRNLLYLTAALWLGVVTIRARSATSPSRNLGSIAGKLVAAPISPSYSGI
jgi:4-amino-4-deoxy-L-arabinose transferase-like glycosyltransferase